MALILQRMLIKHKRYNRDMILHSAIRTTSQAHENDLRESCGVSFHPLDRHPSRDQQCLKKLFQPPNPSRLKQRPGKNKLKLSA